jgi:hypothetical protein
MFTRARDTLFRLATLRNVILLWAAFTGFSIGIFNFGFLSKLEEYARGNIVLDNTFFFYTAGYVHQLFTTYGSAGRSLYLSHLLVFDFIYPAFFFVTNAISTIWLLNYLMPSAKITRHIHLFPLAPALLDYLENIGILTMLAFYPNLPAGIVSAISLITIIKISLVNILFLLAVALVAGAVIKFIRHKISQQLF